MTKQIMVRAWAIAKAAIVKFGGRVREYLAAALKQAWAEARAPKKVQVKVEFDAYNSRRYSRPWGAVVTFEGSKPAYHFNAGAYMGSDNGGTLYVDCKPGQIVAVGQRDGRGGNTKNEWIFVEATGTTRTVERAEAFELWKNQRTA